MVIAPPPPTATTCGAKPSVLLEPVRAALAAYAAQPEIEIVRREAAAVQARAAAAIALLPAGQRSGSEVEAALEILKLFYQSGLSDYAVTGSELALADDYRRFGWPGLLAAMVTVPAWQWTNAPRLDDVPTWLWSDYTRYLFAVPQGFTSVGQADAYAAHILRRLDQLSRLASANRGSASVRSAVGAYLAVGNCIPIYFANDSLRRHYELRARILAAGTRTDQVDAGEPLPRFGRKLRVGFINRHFGPQTETYTTLPMFEQLDPTRFEVALFVHQQTDAAVETHARSRVAEFHVLQGSVAAQLETLRSASLDVAVFGTNVTAVANEVTLLALHRVAPLQVVNNSSCTTTGMPEIDLYVSGAATESEEAPAHFSERLGLVAGPAHAFNYQADRVEPTTTWTREALGLPADATVFVTAANYFKVIPEMQHTWAKLLAAVPGSHLLIHPFNPNWSSSYPIQRFKSEFEKSLNAHGVATKRVVVSSNRFPSRSDVKSLLSVGDIYLDSFPFGGVNSLIDPLELGIPTIVWEGSTFRSRMGSALLRSIGITELIASNEAEYLAVAERLAGDRDARVTLGERIQLAMETAPDFLDPLAASDAFGALLETAYDELTNVGRENFCRERTPLRAPSFDEAATLENGHRFLDAGLFDDAIDAARNLLGQNPTSVEARKLMGRALSARGDHDRGIAYLLAALQRAGNDAMLWYYIARALQANGQVNETLQAVEGCLRAGPQCLDGWLMLAELAQAAGNQSLLEETVAMAKQVAPNDPRVAAFGC